MTRPQSNGRPLAEAWTLEGKDGEGRSLRLLLSEQELARSEFGIAVGRHPDLCDRVIDDPSVSRRHFRLSIKEGALRLEDLNALNGTLLDGRPLSPFQPQPVRPGQVLILGRVFLEVREAYLDGTALR
jgi:predicted component of type VI protein secretion system